MDEFGLIDHIVEALGGRAKGPWIKLGPGDDAAIITPSSGFDQVASIDVLLPDVHFPAQAPAFLIGYRALMVSLSDIAAMGASARYCTVALTLTENHAADLLWVGDLSKGMAQAASDSDAYICGGNITRGPLNIAISAHGEVRQGEQILRSGGNPSDKLFVSGPVGGAGACVRKNLLLPVIASDMHVLQRAYYKPRARFDCLDQLRLASCAIDISDGLLQDLAHLTKASGCGARLIQDNIPLVDGAEIEDALNASDDYQILFASAHSLPNAIHIGELCSQEGIWIDQKQVKPSGYKHF